MGILEIILIGYLCNALSIALITFLLSVLSIFNMFNPVYMSKFLELNEETQKSKIYKLKLRKMNKSTLTTDSFIFILPYATVLQTGIIIIKSLKYGLLEAMFFEIKKVNNELEDRININN
jgi:hypothetical protein